MADHSYIIMYFVRFSLETNRDFVNAGYGQNITHDATALHLTGSKAPNSLTINSTKIWITFHTNHVGQWTGFNIALQATDVYRKLFLIIFDK